MVSIYVCPKCKKAFSCDHDGAECNYCGTGLVRTAISKNDWDRFTEKQKNLFRSSLVISQDSEAAPTTESDSAPVEEYTTSPHLDTPIRSTDLSDISERLDALTGAVLSVKKELHDLVLIFALPFIIALVGAVLYFLIARWAML